MLAISSDANKYNSEVCFIQRFKIVHFTAIRNAVKFCLCTNRNTVSMDIQGLLLSGNSSTSTKWTWTNFGTKPLTTRLRILLP